MEKLPKDVLLIFNLFNKANHEIYLVGGCVRDALMNRNIHDYDFTTSALPQQIITILKDYGTIIPTGLKHGTITFLKNHITYEITTFRSEKEYVHHRFPKEVVFEKELIKDLERRDFSINAIAYHPVLGIIDPFLGQKDIENKIIRCIHNPSMRFQEDALRILRALRFHITLSFQIEEHTFLACQQNAHLLSFISKERIHDELIKMLAVPYQNLLSLLYDAHILPYVFPPLVDTYHFNQQTPWHLYDLFQHTEKVLNGVQHESVELKLASIFHDVGKLSTQTFDNQKIAHYPKHAQTSLQIAAQYLKMFHFTNTQIKLICTYIQFHDYHLQNNEKSIRKFLGKLNQNKDTAIEILKLQIADDQAKNLEMVMDEIKRKQACLILIKSIPDDSLLKQSDMVINGNDLLALGYEGKNIGLLLKQLYQYIILYPYKNNTKDLYQYLNQIKKNLML